MNHRIFLIATLLMMIFSSLDSHAQYVPISHDDQTSEVEQTEIIQNADLNKGVPMVNTGKTLMYTGASLAMTGLALYVYGAATWETDPCCPEMPVYPFFAMSLAGAGAAAALIGLPFYIYGNKKMQTYGSSHIVFGNEGQEGAAGFLEMGLGIPNFLSFDALGGYNFGKNFFMGAGVGYKAYLTGGLIQSEGVTASLPVYANARVSIGKKRVVPYIGASAGYDTINGGLYAGVEFGTRFRNINGKRGASWWFGAKAEAVGYDNNYISLKVGRSF